MGGRWGEQFDQHLFILSFGHVHITSIPNSDKMTLALVLSFSSCKWLCSDPPSDHEYQCQCDGFGRVTPPSNKAYRGWQLLVFAESVGC
jgi:hypothetical protein